MVCTKVLKEAACMTQEKAEKREEAKRDFCNAISLAAVIIMRHHVLQ